VAAVKSKNPALDDLQDMARQSGTAKAAKGRTGRDEIPLWNG
jgi:hypothetical protein